MADEDYSGKYLFLGAEKRDLGEGNYGFVEKFLDVKENKVRQFVPTGKGPILLKARHGLEQVLGVAFMHNADEDGIYAVFPAGNYGEIMLKKLGVKKAE